MSYVNVQGAPFVDALAATLGSAAGQALLAEPVAVTSYKVSH